MIKTDLSKFENKWYKPGGALKRLLWYFVNILFFQNPFFPFVNVKVFLLRLFGAKVGKGVVLKPRVNIKYPWFLEVGNFVWIGEDVWIDNLDQVIIGDNCCISQGALILSGNHNYKKSSFDLIVKPIVLEEGVWIGARSIVTKGVKCKSHALLSVGSVASNNLEAYTIYKGNPADAIKERVIKE